MKNFIEIFGWYGMVAIVLAYALLSFDVLESQSIIYQLFNGTGALGIVLVSMYKKAYQPGILNIIWALIALIAIIRILL
ncbi:MAG: hypothetical protein HOE19_04660 [Candidatus Komeilibacteria bacterium]|jgi:hypothetical protein|nr:hypothetical protein [Candidatus Komeilibacteria bacterium]MBT4447963.1 hypothetical protein [Candidatus Komeilibacteria bacterium]